MPSDPFEAELLMMAEAVASGGARGSESDSDASDDAPDNCKSAILLSWSLLLLLSSYLINIKDQTNSLA